MSLLLERISARRAELAEQAQHLTKQLTDVQHELDRVSVAEQVVTQMLAEPEPVGQDTSAQAPGATTSAPADHSFMIIPHRHQVSGAGELPADYQLLLRTVTDADRPLICKHICRAAGLGTESGQVEGTRAKLNRLAEGGWLRKMPAGSFGPYVPDLGRPPPDPRRFPQTRQQTRAAERALGRGTHEQDPFRPRLPPTTTIDAVMRLRGYPAFRRVNQLEAQHCRERHGAGPRSTPDGVGTKVCPGRPATQRFSAPDFHHHNHYQGKHAPRRAFRPTRAACAVTVQLGVPVRILS